MAPVETSMAATHVKEHQIDVLALTHNGLAGHGDAATFLREDGDEVFTYAESDAIKVRWKIDLLLMPLLLGTSMLSFLGKGVLSNASVFGLKEDTHLHDQQYSWVASVFYFGYMLGQPISVYILHKVPVGKWLAINILGFGLSLLFAVTATSFGGIATWRFLLGLFGAVVNPAFVLITSQYYTRREHSLRACIWWSGNAIASFFGDLIAYGIGHSAVTLAPWKLLFITFGGASVLWSVVLAFLLPQALWKMAFLDLRERKIAVIRLLPEYTGTGSSQIDLRQMVSVLTDPQAWILFCIAFIQCLPSGGLTAFNKLILTGLGYSNIQATIMAMPEHAVQLVSVIAAGFAGSYMRNGRCIVMIVSNVPPLVGSLLIYNLPSSAMLSRLAGVYLLFANTVSYIMAMSLVASNFVGMTRKTTVAAGMFLAYSAGNLVAPQLFIDAEAPRYPTGFRGMIASFVALMVLAGVLMFYLIRQNRERDRQRDSNEGGIDTRPDLTDKELVYFRYAW